MPRNLLSSLNITTSAHALEEATRLSGNPHNARDVQKLNAFALFAKGKDLNGGAASSWEVAWEASHPAPELLSVGRGIVKPWNRSAARRAQRERQAARQAAAA